MRKNTIPIKGYFLAVSIGALFGGLLVAITSRAIPKMISEVMSGMMRQMMNQMGAEGCDPSEI